MRKFLDECREREAVLFTDRKKKGNSLGLVSEVILFCFESIYFQSPSYNTDKGTQTVTLG